MKDPQIRFQTCKVILHSFTLLLCLLFTKTEYAYGQHPSEIKPADTSSPRATLNSFIESCNDFYEKVQEDRFFDRTSKEHSPLAMRILDCLDMRELPKYERNEAAGEAATCLKEILDRVELPPEEEIPDVDDLLETSVKRWRIPGTRLTISRIEEGPQRLEYLFTAGTIDRAKDYFRDMQTLPYRESAPETSPGLYEWYMYAPGHPIIARIVDRLPAGFQKRIFGLAYWQWLGIFVCIAATIALTALINKLHVAFRKHHLGQKGLLSLLTLIFPILVVFLLLGLKDVATDYLTIRGDALSRISFSLNLLAFLASLFIVFALFNRISDLVISSPQINPQGLDAQFVRILCKLLAILVSVVVFLEGGNYLGIPISTLIASAGIGGLAIALAAQDTLRNVFGTIMLLSDKPFRVGERIIFGSYDGSVEEIGLRSTKIRLLTGHQATIPNDELARNDIENVGRRRYIRRVADIHIPLNTTSEQLQQAVEIIRGLLKDHEGIDPEYPPRVNFTEFQESSYVIRMIYWYHPPDYWEFLRYSEELNFKVLNELEQSGIRLTQPIRIANVESEGKPE